MISKMAGGIGLNIHNIRGTGYVSASFPRCSLLMMCM